MCGEKIPAPHPKKTTKFWVPDGNWTHDLPGTGQMHIYQSPKYKNLEMSRNLCIVILKKVLQLSFYFQQCLNTLWKSPAGLLNAPDINNSTPKLCQLSTMYCAMWLVDIWPITILIKHISIWLFLCFLIKNSWKKSTKSTSCFIFLSDISKNNENINEKIMKKATPCISQEIRCSNQKNGRFDEKLWESWENRESWQVCRCSNHWVTENSRD